MKKNLKVFVYQTFTTDVLYLPSLNPCEICNMCMTELHLHDMDIYLYTDMYALTCEYQVQNEALGITGQLDT